MGGRFTLSDDSHGIDQVGANYGKVLECIKRAGVAEICHLVPAMDGVDAHDSRFPNVAWKTVSISELESHGFWKSSGQDSLPSSVTQKPANTVRSGHVPDTELESSSSGIELA